MSGSKILLFATRNPGKVRELRDLTAGLAIEVRSLDGYDDVPEVEEDGETFAANASKKARIVSAATGLPALADDSGLEVDALEGAPGVHSARYAGDACDDAANNQKLLEALQGVATCERGARFHSTLALADSAGKLGKHFLLSSGICEGRILEEPRGSGGFGYDPLFYCSQLSMTFAEAGASSKNQVSHRSQAMKQLLPELIRYFDL